MTDVDNLFSGCEVERKRCSDSRKDDEDSEEEVSLRIEHSD